MSNQGAVVVVTGVGAVSPNGVGVVEGTRGLRAGRSGLVELPFEHPHVRTPAVGMVRDFEATSVLPAGELRRLPRLIPLALAAAREAMSMATLGPFPGGDEHPNQAMDEHALRASRRIGLILGTGGGGIDFTLAQAELAAHGKTPSLWTITNATHGNLAGELSIRLGLRGPSHCISTGCTSSSDAIGTALLHLQTGRLDAIVVGGADSHLVPGSVWSMQLLGALSTGNWSPPQTASRPFDRLRDGFILGEGAWFLVLERSDYARNRGVEALATVAGYGCTCDAYHRVRPDPDAGESARAIHLALEQADLAPGDVQYVQYHGTGTQLNDLTETRAIRKAFGPHADLLPGSSIKSMIGHPQGACGAASVVATIAALRGLDGGEAFLPPTINLDEPDPACDLDYVPRQARATQAKVALVNCLGFGAKNSALVLRLD